MFLLVKFSVSVGVLEPEIGAEIKNARASVEERPGELRGETVRQRQKNNTRIPGDLFGFR